MPYQKETYFYPSVILLVVFIRYKIKRFLLKTITIKYLLLSVLLLLLIACSTKKNTWLSRNSHALSTKDNILYNGGLALEKGIEEVRLQNSDNFWGILSVERMQVNEEKLLPGITRNANFEKAETKATKGIQKHSMNINGSEKNPQMDEAYLMLGKARYYDQRFVPALDAFNYVLNKSPNSNKIYEVKIWREKTNMRLENDALAVNNLRKLLKEIKFKDQIFADANAALAQAFINLKQKDSAVIKLKIAKEFTKSKEEKSRYFYILGQLYEELGYKDSAFACYQSVIDMRRKAAKQYVIHAHIRQASQQDYSKMDSATFFKKYNYLLKDRENRPFLDILHHQVALFYEKRNDIPQAKKEYNLSLKTKTKDTYLIASNYRNLADLYFIESKFSKAGNYYDSTLVYLKPRTREFNLIKKKRVNLDDVIKYESISQKNDSIISLFSLSNSERVSYFEKHIDKLKKVEEKLKIEAEKAAQIKENQERNDGSIESNGSKTAKKENLSGVKTTNMNALDGSNSFYFYNSSTVSYGKVTFVKNWGKRKLTDNWRVSSLSEKIESNNSSENENPTENTNIETTVDIRFTPDFYIKDIPTSQTVIDSLSKERNFANYQLGIIYKEKFKEYNLAVKRFEKLLESNPENRLILPSMYNLYKLYSITDKTKAIAMKDKIIAQYPDSRYAQILVNPKSEAEASNDSPNVVYQNIYKQYESGQIKETLKSINTAINLFTGEEIIPKLELLKANIVGKLSGLSEYSTALNYVALNYPNYEEGKRAENLLSIDLPKLEALQLSNSPSKNWKILFETKDFEDAKTKVLREKLKKFITERSLNNLTISLDIYTAVDNFVVIHGINTLDLAQGITAILKDYKDYKLPETPIIISAENYSIVQIKKNLNVFLAGNLPDSVEQPNWDGTLEKLPEPTEQPQVFNTSKTEKSVQSDENNSKARVQNIDVNSVEGQDFDTPPSPQKGGEKIKK